MSYTELQELWTPLGRILLAALLGGLLGFERDIHGRGAGLRTHLLVSIGACVFMELSTRVESFGVALAPAGFNRVTDPARIAAQVVTGIGFLGAGVIIKEGLSVRGLTTAACLWVAAAIGMASGVGFFAIAVFTTAVALLALTFLRYVEGFYRRDVYRDLSVLVPIGVDIRIVMDTVKSSEVQVISYSMERDYESQTTDLKMSLRLFHRGNVEKLSYLIVEKLESGGIPLKALKWLKP
jgi:putative Mg2+ transporter-C (MgtC) family protein